MVPARQATSWPAGRVGPNGNWRSMPTSCRCESGTNAGAAVVDVSPTPVNGGRRAASHQTFQEVRHAAT